MNGIKAAFVAVCQRARCKETKRGKKYKMKIDICEKNNAEQRRLLVTLEPDELDGYGVSMRSMSLFDQPTKVMLHDILTFMEHIGLRSQGERVSVDCAETQDGGCVLLLSALPDTVYRFDGSDELLAAYRAGALPDKLRSLEQSDGSWLVRLADKLEPDEECFLREFCS